ncbi:glycosyltransferase family 4 protein [bacterium]|nr:glycosyltransferase family 4 protein [bacterium]
MKICQVTDHLPKYHEVWGGAEQACYRLIKLLNKERSEVSVLSTKPAKTPKENFKFFMVKTLENYLIPTLRKYSVKVKTIFFPFDPVSYISFYKILKKLKPDILHFHNFKILSLSLLYIAKILKIPTLLTIYDYWYFCPKETLFNSKGEVCKKFQGTNCIGCYRFKRIRYLQNLFLPFRKRIFNFFLSRVDAFLVLSKSSSKILRRYGIDQKKIHLIPQAFSFKDRDTQKIKEIEQGAILYIGWIQHRKGLHVILEAMPRILKKIPKARLYVIGEWVDREYEERVRSLIGKYHLTKNISILGKKNYPEVKKFLQRASVVVVPEQWENMSPVVLIEAMAHAKPIVASGIGGIPEFMSNGENGLLANPKDPFDFSKKIIWTLKNGKKASEIGRKAREDVRQICDEKKILKATLNLYKSLVRE